MSDWIQQNLSRYLSYRVCSGLTLGQTHLCDSYMTLFPSSLGDFLVLLRGSLVLTVLVELLKINLFSKAWIKSLQSSVPFLSLPLGDFEGFTYFIVGTNLG